MNLDEIKRGLRAEIKKRENEQYFTCQTNIREMCKDVLAKLEEQESEIAELKSTCVNTDNSAVIENMAVELEKLRPMETALELAEADNKGYLARIKTLEEERRWRNLKDEQPQEGERVLIVDEYFQDISMAMYTDDHCWELNSGATILTTVFPYWMPLPKTPKEADK